MSTAPDTLKDEIKRAIVESLRLDSIDVLELVLEMERRFGVSITEEETGQRVLRSVDTIADFIMVERAKKTV
jgi:acyl carrier protein